MSVLAGLLLVLLSVAAGSTTLISIMNKFHDGRIPRPVYRALFGWWQRPLRSETPLSILADSIASGAEEFGWVINDWDCYHNLSSKNLKSGIGFDRDGLATVRTTGADGRDTYISPTSYEDYLLYSAALRLRRIRKKKKVTRSREDGGMLLLQNFRELETKLVNEQGHQKRIVDKTAYIRDR